MSLLEITAGYMPLVDAAPLIVAKEMGFAEEEGLALDLMPSPSWSTLRDMLAFGQIQAAHMLSPVPVASWLGLMNGLPKLQALSVMSMNGNVIGVSPTIADALEALGHSFDFENAKAAALAVAALPRPLRVGVPFLLSMHAELVSLWLSSAGLTAGKDFQIHAVPPTIMAQAIRNGDLDLFCVGEPWGSVTVETADGALLLPGAAIWSAAPEKVLATRADWTDNHPEPASRLIRAVWRAGEWLDQTAKHTALAELLARKDYVGVASDLVDRALSGRLMINSRGEQRSCAQFLQFHKEAATFPWRSQEAWIAERLTERFTPKVPFSGQSFRSDLYRAALEPLGVAMPLSSYKVEGALGSRSHVRGQSGSLSLGANRFFDGQVFDPTS
ncbi:MAG: ABC transporter substrate-binding protein [Cognatishimia sp.]|uniref:ABC transporter substrate-binding protein n=1 Tax=Cognatishimia sp. TaxID=2211648 RepID=UPI004059BB89